MNQGPYRVAANNKQTFTSVDWLKSENHRFSRQMIVAYRDGGLEVRLKCFNTLAIGRGVDIEDAFLKAYADLLDMCS